MSSSVAQCCETCKMVAPQLVRIEAASVTYKYGEVALNVQIKFSEVISSATVSAELNL
ncbi:MAG: hypothetical protein JST89_13815 [Cyanobacteria bacterium SZAS-4]|nr:hypothetical protein [Cyanobacteria bacterium SZAS-4]